ncbi:MAG TPA: TonB family protein [Gemmatimonadaceae bacterium]|nr:TonB family protein [Gemmatimonadaceae bacterium]
MARGGCALASFAYLSPHWSFRRATGCFPPGGDTVARPRQALSPKYPDLLRSANVEGEVVLDIAIDTAGRVDPSRLKVIRSDHQLFLKSVRQAIDTTAWLPARQMGRPIQSVRRDTISFLLKNDSAAACPKSTDHHRRICILEVTVQRTRVS